MITVSEWIEREFRGHGRALRSQGEAPLEDEPWMSMADAKELTRRAVADFSTCEYCSLWASRSREELATRLGRLKIGGSLADPVKCPRCFSTSWARTSAFIEEDEPPGKTRSATLVLVGVFLGLVLASALVLIAWLMVPLGGLTCSLPSSFFFWFCR